MIPHLLPVHPNFISLYNQKIEEGKKFLENSKITVISLVRDIDLVLIKNISLIMNFMKQYDTNVNHIFYENDSIDKTKLILKQFKGVYPENMHVFSEDLNREFFGSVKSSDRLKALSEYRNKTKEYAKTLESDFVIVLDMDFDQINLDGILNSFGWLASEPSVSAVVGNSFLYRPGLYPADPTRYNLINYDSWAFRHTWWTDLHVASPAPNNTLDSMLWFSFWIPPTGSYPITVNSGFGGCAIYRSNIYFEGEYDSMDCEHVCFHYSLSNKKNLNFRLVLNPSQQMIFQE